MPTRRERRQQKREAKHTLKENEKQYWKIYEDIVRMREKIFNFEPGQGDMDVALDQLKELLSEYSDLQIASALDTMIRSNDIFYAPENFSGVQYINYSLTGMLLMSGSADYGFAAEFNQGKLVQASPFVAVNGGFVTNFGVDLTANFGVMKNATLNDFFGWGNSISASASPVLGIIGLSGGFTNIGNDNYAQDNIYDGELYGYEKPTRKFFNSIGYSAIPMDFSVMTGYTSQTGIDIFGLGLE